MTPLPDGDRSRSRLRRRAPPTGRSRVRQSRPGIPFASSARSRCGHSCVARARRRRSGGGRACRRRVRSRARVSPMCWPVTRSVRSTRSTSCTSPGGALRGRSRRRKRDERERVPALEWRDGEMLHDKHRGAELIWFPEPVGARECELVATGVELLVAANPGAGRVTARLGVPLGAPAHAARATGSGRGVGCGTGGSVGLAGTSRTSVVYGVIERTGVAAGTVLGVTAAWLAGALPIGGRRRGTGGIRSGFGGQDRAVPCRTCPSRRQGGDVRRSCSRLRGPGGHPAQPE